MTALFVPIAAQPSLWGKGDRGVGGTEDLGPIQELLRKELRQRGTATGPNHKSMEGQDLGVLRFLEKGDAGNGSLICDQIRRTYLTKAEKASLFLLKRGGLGCIELRLVAVFLLLGSVPKQMHPSI